MPEIVIRELVANALIHQDFRITGASIMVEKSVIVSQTISSALDFGKTKVADPNQTSTRYRSYVPSWA
ncbi:MAG: hypothetical protein V2A66_00545 [Pseudomonadota bacterium]